jgi:ribosomal protein S12 methylthiotransferase
MVSNEWVRMSLETKAVKVCLVSLGCPKNLVDSEVLLGAAAEDGILVARDPEDADVAVINTCGFIDSAKEESIQTILEIAKLKTAGELKGLIVVGCLSQRYGDELRRDLPEVDAVLGLSDYSKVPALIKHLAKGGDARFVMDTRGGKAKTKDSDRRRLLLTPKSYAYLRIGEGCDHSCSFCAIPLIRGKQRSKPIDVLVEEAQGLAAGGVRELVLVAEDSTAYGMDWAGNKRMLAPLLEALGMVDGIEWIRVLYAYPHTVRPAITEQLRENPKVVPYIDIPIQHISSRMLQAMKRGVSSSQVRKILHRLRDEVPGIAIRSTFILGFPGEKQEDFEELLGLTREFQFERLGVFPFSREEGTTSFEMKGDADPSEVQDRIAAIMEASRSVIEKRNRNLIGSRMKVLVDGALEGERLQRLGWSQGSVGRTFADAPEIDCEVYFEGSLPSGSFIEGEIVGSNGYDLLARSVSSSSLA